MYVRKIKTTFLKNYFLSLIKIILLFDMYYIKNIVLLLKIITINFLHLHIFISISINK